jgi:hypothetical protein
MNNSGLNVKITFLYYTLKLYKHHYFYHKYFKRYDFEYYTIALEAGLGRRLWLIDSQLIFVDKISLSKFFNIF